MSAPLGTWGRSARANGSENPWGGLTPARAVVASSPNSALPTSPASVTAIRTRLPHRPAPPTCPRAPALVRRLQADWTNDPTRPRDGGCAVPRRGLPGSLADLRLPPGPQLWATGAGAGGAGATRPAPGRGRDTVPGGRGPGSRARPTASSAAPSAGRRNSALLGRPPEAPRRSPRSAGRPPSGSRLGGRSGLLGHGVP